MVMVTRLLYLVSGLILLATGIYVESRFTGMLTDIWRMSILLAAGLYFLIQLYRLLTTECTPTAPRSSVELSQQFRA
jgi:hypothetical protein